MRADEVSAADPRVRARSPGQNSSNVRFWPFHRLADFLSKWIPSGWPTNRELDGLFYPTPSVAG